MKKINFIFKKLVLTLAITLMTTASAWAQTYWSGVVTLNNGQNVSGLIVLTADTWVNVPSGTATISGQTTGNCSLYKNGNGTLNITGALAHGGSTAIQDGPLTFSGTSTVTTNIALVASSTTLTFSRSSDYTYSGVISGAGNVVKTGDATLIFTGNNTYTGTTTISAGTLRTGSHTTTGAIVGNIINNSFLSCARSDDYTYSGVISGEGNVSNVGNGALILTSPNNSYTGVTNIYSGTIRLLNGGNLTGTSGVNIAANAWLDLYPSGNLTFNRVISGEGKVYKSNSGKAILTANNTYTGQTTVIQGTLQIANGSTSGSINNTSDVVVQSGGTLRFQSSYQTTFSKVISGSGNVEHGGSGELYFTANNTYTGTTTIEAGTGWFHIGNNTTTGAIAGNIICQGGTLRFYRSNDYTYSGVISGEGNDIHKQGSGVLTLTGASTYTHGILVYEGTLVLGAGGSIENANYVEIMGNLDISSGNKKFKSLSVSSSSEVILGSSTLTIGTAGGNDGSGSCWGKFSGTGSITKLGSGTLTMGNTQNTATGTFTLSSGTLNFGSNWAGNFVKSANAVLTVNGNSTIGGNLTLEGGAINMDLTTNPPSKITVNGGIWPSGTNTLKLTTHPVNDHVLIQAASGISNTTPYTVDLPDFYSYYLTATGSQLLLTASVFGGGNGSEATPYLITTPQHLAQLSTFVNDGNATYNDKYYKLENNIDLSAYGAGFNEGKGWIPIGMSETNSFKGNFDGNRKKITGLYINDPNRDCAGLFGFINLGNLKNFGVEGCNITGKDFLGGIVGRIWGSNITNCYATGTLSGRDYVGGIIGNIYAGTIANSYSIAKVSGNNNIGGIAGQIYDAHAINCYAVDEASGNGMVGGIAGVHDAVSSIVKCVSLNASVKGTGTNVGRIAGYKYTAAQLSDNAAYDGMLNNNNTTVWSNKGANLKDGADISKEAIRADGTLDGRFTSADGWTTQNGKLPGLFGETVNMPEHLGGVGIVEMLHTTSLQVYPNPTTGELKMENGKLKINNVEIFDIYGRKQKIIFNSQFSTFNSVDISHLPAGVYFLRIDGEMTKVVKIN